ncbi:MAG: sigma-70 family RNA polymerase sigma factor [Prevotella sp.]|nr:sigma-70 family RNA polymerase sigma factor [Prevotella sp.]
MYRGLDEQSLARLCSENDRRAQEELYTRYAGRLFTLCLRYSDSRDEAQDLVHDSMLKALEKISSFTYRGSGSLYAWISRIAINMALAQISRYKFRFSRLTSSVSEDFPDPTDDEFARIPQEKLLEFISGLPDTQRAIFNLFCLDGYSHKEIADMLGISERGSTSMLTKAKHALRKQINDYIKNSE